MAYHYDEEMIWAVKKGKLDFIQSHVLVRGADPHAHDGEAFCHACLAGQLHVAQWLRAQPGFDLGVCGNRAFAWSCACTHGNFAVIQWLWSIMADAHFRPDLKRAFANACYYRNWAVAKWVVSVVPRVDDLGIHDEDDSLIRRTVSDCIVPAQKAVLCLGRWLLSLDPHWPSWPAWAVDRLKVWSPARDAWMRACVHA